ncbi:MAG TPA: hypothetical protein VET85_10050 [Stellaceae bacterium]|nr:hypothetical protein [Stellaceae bacterium]
MMGKRWLKVVVPLVPLLTGAVALTITARADEHDHERWHDRGHDEHGGREHHFDEHGHHDFHGHDYHRFNEFELALWSGGGWHHDWWGGRYGWWWEVDGVRYYYPEPIYPYPTFVPETAVVIAAPPSYPPPQPPPVIIQQAPPAPPPPAGPAPAQSWYYCDASAAYYPYVQSCASPWRQVPAAPPAGQ